MHYVYIYCDPRRSFEGSDFVKFKPFYIGKGSGRRKLAHLNTENKHHPNKFLLGKVRAIINAGFEPIIVTIENLLEADAYQLEKELVEKFGRKFFDVDGILYNLTTGGKGGQTGFKHPNSIKRGKDNGMFGRTHSPEARLKISETSKKLRHSEETKTKMSEARRNGANYNTMSWVVISPIGEEIEVDWLKGFCNEHGINYNSLYNSLSKGPITRGPSKGWWLRSNSKVDSSQEHIEEETTFDLEECCGYS